MLTMRECLWWRVGFTAALFSLYVCLEGALLRSLKCRELLDCYFTCSRDVPAFLQSLGAWEERHHCIHAL